MHKFKKNIQNVFLLIVSLISCVFIGEIIIRFKSPMVTIFPPHNIYEASSTQGFKLKPDFKSKYISTNSKGLRDRDFSYTKERDVYRILCLGDSFTFGHGVRLDEAWPKRLEKMLNANLQHKRYEVINAGIDGYGTYQQFIYLRDEGKRFNPNLVIVGFFGANDVEEVSKGFFWRYVEDGYLKQKGLKRRFPLPLKLRVFFREHSHLYNFLASRDLNLLTSLFKKQRSRQLPEIYRDDYSHEFQQAIDETKGYLRKINELAIKNDARMLLVLIPWAIEINQEEWKNRGYEALYNDELFNENMLKISKMFGEFSRDSNILTLDLLPVFRRQSNEVFYFKNESHWNANGHRLAAEEIYNFLLARRVLKEN